MSTEGDGEGAGSEHLRQVDWVLQNWKLKLNNQMEAFSLIISVNGTTSPSFHALWLALPLRLSKTT